MQTQEAINKRRSVRRYSEKEISREDLIRIVDAGRLAASARNEQPWEFIVVREKEKKRRLGEIASPNGEFIKDSAAVIAVFCRDSKYYLEDGCAATQNILLMAADLGIGSCWIAGDKKPYCDAVNEFLKAPQEYKLISLVSLGYSNKPLKDIIKRQLNEVIHWEVF